jgi:hypothetical protein
MDDVLLDQVPVLTALNESSHFLIYYHRQALSEVRTKTLLNRTIHYVTIVPHMTRARGLMMPMWQSRLALTRSEKLEHFSYFCRAAKGSLNQAIASSAVSSGSSSVMA